MFAYLYRKFFEELLQPDDDFFTRCRKAVITCYLIFGIINVFTNTATVVSISKDQWTAVKVVNYLIYYIGSAIWIATWMYARLTRTSPDWLVNLIQNTGLFILVLMHFSSPNWDWHAFCLSAAVGAVIIGTSHMKLQVAVCSFVFIINAYDTLGFPSILLPGNYKGNKVVRQILNGIAASLAVWAVHLTMKQFCLLIAKSAANVRMAKEVAKMLAAYDTTGVTERLLTRGAFLHPMQFKTRQ